MQRMQRYTFRSCSKVWCFPASTATVFFPQLPMESKCRAWIQQSCSISTMAEEEKDPAMEDWRWLTQIKKKHFLMTHISYTYPFLLICWKAETKVESRNYKTKWNGKNVQELYRHTCIVPYQIIRGSLVRKLPSYGRLSMASCLTIMATTSSCQSHHHQVPRKCERSGTRKCTAENTLGRKTLFFFG